VDLEKKKIEIISAAHIENFGYFHLFQEKYKLQNTHNTKGWATEIAFCSVETA
jgi:hypothetical protein